MTTDPVHTFGSLRLHPTGDDVWALQVFHGEWVTMGEYSRDYLDFAANPPEEFLRRLYDQNPDGSLFEYVHFKQLGTLAKEALNAG